MNDGRDALVIALAAFSGGLVGAVLQPAMSYLFDRLRSETTIRKTRQRNNRPMLTAKIREGRGYLASAATIHLLFSGGELIVDKAKRIDDLQPEKPEGYLWQPHRIDDENLRDMAIEYNQVAADLYGQILQDRPNYEETARLGGLLETLQVQITNRMDKELNWPEVED